MKYVMVGALGLAGGLCGVARAASQTRVVEVAAEIRREIADVRQAISEVTKHDDNLAEICFRVGALYTSARHELEEASNSKAPAAETKAAAENVKALIADAKSLPSFCGDKEKTKEDPGYERVPRGDIARLKAELTSMDSRAAALAKP